MRPLLSLLALLAVGPAVAETVVVPVPSPYSYESTSLRRLQLNNSSDRYLGFTGHTVIEWPATPARLDAGNPGSIRCNSNRCWQEGYVAPSLTGGTPAGSVRQFFQYELDCRDQTYNRIGDLRVPGNFPKGWQSVTTDPTALAVASEWCPRIQELPQ